MREEEEEEVRNSRRRCGLGCGVEYIDRKVWDSCGRGFQLMENAILGCLSDWLVREL